MKNNNYKCSLLNENLLFSSKIKIILKIYQKPFEQPKVKMYYLFKSISIIKGAF
ncbi:hypothetical protein JOD44_002823 [Salimicrobium jeotgali]|nr:hypothetical protein [Salimicrobium jeotgali]